MSSTTASIVSQSVEQTPEGVSMFNIVNFMETNKLSTLSSTYNNTLLEKIKNNFTDTEQHLFISSFYCYLNYNSTKDYVIDFDNVWKWLDFTHKHNAKVLLKKHFTENIDYKIELALSQSRKRPPNVQKGGENKETILLTVNTFKKLCLKAGTKKSNEIHDYFIKLEELLQEVIKEESEELRKQLQVSDTKIQKLEIENINLKRTNEIDKHNILCDQHDKKGLVYIMKLETLMNGNIIIKIGETTDIKSRCQAISAYFGIRVTVLELYPCDYNYEFEQFIHKDPSIKKYKYTGLINNSRKSKEAYVITGDREMNKIKQFIKRNIFNYNSKDRETVKNNAILGAMEIFKHDPDKVKEVIDQIVNAQPVSFIPPTNQVIPNNRVVYDQILRNAQTGDDDPSQDPIDDYIQPNTTPQETTPNSYSPKVQIYDPTDLTKVVSWFPSITEATRVIEGTSYSHIKYAFRNKIVYKNYRWNILPHTDHEPEKQKDIGKTIESVQRKSGIVAMLNMDKTEIIKTFPLQKEAAKYANTHSSLICTAIRYGSSVAGHYWVSWDDLPQELQNKYLETNELPVIEKRTKGQIVQQINPDTNMIVKEFPSINDATKEMRISPKSIKLSDMENRAVGGWIWRIVS